MEIIERVLIYHSGENKKRNYYFSFNIDSSYFNIVYTLKFTDIKLQPNSRPILIFFLYLGTAYEGDK